MATLDELQQALIDGKAVIAKEATQALLQQGVPPSEFFPKAIIPAMDEVGRRMRQCEYFISEVLLSARAARSVTEVLRPLLVGEQTVKPAGIVVCGTVKGDLHDIGKNLVIILLESAGFRIIDLGVDVTPEKFVNAVREHKADLLALSAMLTTTMVNMKTVIEMLRSAEIRDLVKIMVGGASVTQGWARSIGADAYGKDALSAVDIARQLVRSVPS